MRSSVCCAGSPLRWWRLLKVQLGWSTRHQLSAPLLPEVQLDIFRCLDRFDLDAMQFSSRQLRNFLEVLAVHLPIRHIDEAVFVVRDCKFFKKTYVIARNGRRKLRFSGKKSSIEDKLCFVMKALEDAHVDSLQLHCGGAGPLVISEEILTITAAKARNVTVGWLALTGWAFPAGTWPLADVFALATSFPRVDLIVCAGEPPSAMYECALRGYASRGVAFPDVGRDGCCPLAAADAVHGYSFCSDEQATLWLIKAYYANPEFLIDEFVQGSYVHASEPARVFIRKHDVPVERYALEKYASMRVPSATDDHISFFFGNEHPGRAFKAQICLHDSRLTFRYTSDPSEFDKFLVCKGPPKPRGAY